jgi:hypothetical protein
MEQATFVLLFKLFTVLALLVFFFSRPFGGGRPPYSDASLPGG